MMYPSFSSSNTGDDDGGNHDRAVLKNWGGGELLDEGQLSDNAGLPSDALLQAYINSHAMGVQTDFSSILNQAQQRRQDETRSDLGTTAKHEKMNNDGTTNTNTPSPMNLPLKHQISQQQQSIGLGFGNSGATMQDGMMMYSQQSGGGGLHPMPLQNLISQHQQQMLFLRQQQHIMQQNEQFVSALYSPEMFPPTIVSGGGSISATQYHQHQQLVSGGLATAGTTSNASSTAIGARSSGSDAQETPPASSTFGGSMTMMTLPENVAMSFFPPLAPSRPAGGGDGQGQTYGTSSDGVPRNMMMGNPNNNSAWLFPPQPRPLDDTAGGGVPSASSFSSSNEQDMRMMMRDMPPFVGFPRNASSSTTDMLTAEELCWRPETTLGGLLFGAKGGTGAGAGGGNDDHEEMAAGATNPDEQDELKQNIVGGIDAGSGSSSDDGQLSNPMVGAWSAASAELLGDLEQSTREKANRSRKKPKNKPKRPLSAYNIFFKEERERILEAIPDEMAGATSSSSLNTQSRTPPRKGKKTPHGKIGFQCLAKEVGRRWQSMSLERMEVYKAKANADLDRYKREMEEYVRNRALETKHSKEEGEGENSSNEEPIELA